MTIGWTKINDFRYFFGPQAFPNTPERRHVENMIKYEITMLIVAPFDQHRSMNKDDFLGKSGEHLTIFINATEKDTCHL